MHQSSHRRASLSAEDPEPLALIAATLRGEPSPYPADVSTEFAETLLDTCAAHGVGPLLRHFLAELGIGKSWPAVIQDRLRESALATVANELTWESEISEILAQLADTGVQSLLLKVAPLAYTLYPKPDLRPRCDTDLLVVPAQRDLTIQVLEQAGYRAAESAGGRLASYQTAFSRSLGAGRSHVIDLHWRINNAQVFARAFGFDELAAEAMPVPRLGPAARAPCPVHALLIACLHRTAHLGPPIDVAGLPYLEANRLIWLYDIHLLANTLSGADWSRLTDLAEAKGLRAVCLDGLRTTQRYLRMVVADEALDRLAAPGPPELAARYLAAAPLRRHWLDLRALPGWRERLRLLHEWTIPPADYMFRKYDGTSRWLLPWLYLRRAITGIDRRRP
jgi:hypothetical protein